MFEPYLINTSSRYLKYIIQFRTGNHKLPIVLGRWNNINRNNRTCTLCNRDIGDEFHCLLVCSGLNIARKTYLNSKYYVRPNILKFKSVMKISNKAQYRKVCEFIKLIIVKFN